MLVSKVRPLVDLKVTFCQYVGETLSSRDEDHAKVAQWIHVRLPWIHNLKRESVAFHSSRVLPSRANDTCHSIMLISPCKDLILCTYASFRLCHLSSLYCDEHPPQKYQRSHAGWTYLKSTECHLLVPCSPVGQHSSQTFDRNQSKACALSITTVPSRRL